jgi:hypothetical protein
VLREGDVATLTAYVPPSMRNHGKSGTSDQYLVVLPFDSREWLWESSTCTCVAGMSVCSHKRFVALKVYFVQYVQNMVTVNPAGISGPRGSDDAGAGDSIGAESHMVLPHPAAPCPRGTSTLAVRHCGTGS